LGQRLAVNSFTVINTSSTAKNGWRSQRHSSDAIHSLGHNLGQGYAGEKRPSDERQEIIRGFRVWL